MGYPLSILKISEDNLLIDTTVIMDPCAAPADPL